MTVTDWIVEEAEYQGDGYWAEYPPLAFRTKKEADDYVRLVETNAQIGGKRKVRRVYADAA